MNICLRRYIEDDLKKNAGFSDALQLFPQRGFISENKDVMKTIYSIFFIRVVGIFFLGISLPGLSTLDAQDGDKSGDKKKKPPIRKKHDSKISPMRIGGDIWGSISEKERKKLREVLTRVWANPEVQSAREEVKNAAENYKEAVKNAVGNEDPLVAKLLVRVQAENEGRLKRLLPDRHPHHGGGAGERRGPEQMLMGPPGFLDRLSKEDRKKFLKAQLLAKEEPAVKEALKELGKIRRKDDAFRKERLQAFMKLRRVSAEALLSIDPELKTILPKISSFRVKNKHSEGKRHLDRPAGKEKKKAQ